jgi:2-dehydro-3-deoxy-D-gluconate 5-dehydrogenase
MGHHRMFSLEGECALVTGGASGIGRAIAIAMARAGANVAITTHNQPGDDTLNAVRAEGRRAHAVFTDLGKTSPETAEAVIADVGHAFGKISILVNNAGIIRRMEAIDQSADDWRAVMATDLDAVWYLSQAAGRRMIASGHGSIINIASLLSFQGGIRVPGYAAAKHAVAGLTRALANEWAAKGVNVNAIAPGYIVTDNTAPLRADETRSRQILERIPAGRWGEAKEIAGTAVFLAAPASRYIHGQVLAVDGGWLAR